MKKQLLIGLAICAILMTGCQFNQPDHSKMNHNSAQRDHSEMNHAEMKSAPNAASAEYDLQFLDTMIPHHEGAVEMAQMLEDKAQNAELKALGKNIIADQNREIAQMKEWREKRFAGKPSALNMELAGMADSMRGMDMKKLGSLSGKEFDLEFIKQMIPHHEGAVLMAKEALGKSNDAEIKRLSESIIKSQDVEIKQMQDWQKSLIDKK